MYLSFYGLERKPFQISTNPSFVWLGDMHKEALALLKYGILENQGFLLLTGDVGTGKTTLINALTNSLDNEFIVAKVPDPGMETIDFMNYISHAFDMKKKFVSKDAFLIHFSHFLNSAYAAGKKVLLIIDESQRLSSDLLEEVRQLSNIENRGIKLLNIFLIGQNEFNDILQEGKNRALYQRISVNYVINPLDALETGEFIRHRLKIAGSQRDIFNSDAIREIYEFSGGLPRRINIICDHALLSGFYRGVKTVTRGVVIKCTKDLRLPGSSGKANGNSLKSGNSFSSEVFKATSPERFRDAGFTHVWRTVGIVLLVAMAVFVITYVNSPREYRDLFYLLKNNGMQVSNVLPEISGTNSGNYSDADMQTASIQVIETQAEMLVSDEGAAEQSVANGQLAKNVEHVSEVLENDSTKFPQEISTVPVQPDELPSTHPIKKNIADEVNSADIALSQFFPPDQQTVIDEDVAEERPFSSETVVELESEVGPVGEETEKTEKTVNIVMLEKSVLIVDIPVAEMEKTDVINAFETSSSDESGNESEESIETQTASAAFLAIKEYMKQSKSDDVPDEPVKRTVPGETEEIINGVSENVDPSAVIDWVIKNRSE
ncbi:MAG: AAA family ATPase [Desulfobulbaceae bacterium]|nr:AAA family ATPase [Desulfobulbaceae bacterium]